jgi:hypothetical protein
MIRRLIAALLKIVSADRRDGRRARPLPNSFC